MDSYHFLPTASIGFKMPPTALPGLKMLQKGGKAFENLRWFKASYSMDYSPTDRILSFC
jgi:hypothetical protein